jgi:catechol 2,3-dioxygenase-like lactoylglutathione lyase family enzyme
MWEMAVQRKFDPKVFQLGYVGLGCHDIRRTADYYAATLGMSQTEKGHDGEVYLSVGYEHHNIVLKETTQKSLMHIGFQLKPNIELNGFLNELRALGLKPMIKSDGQPGVSKLIEVKVVDNVFHFYLDIEAPAPGFKDGGVAPLRLGHFAVISPDADKLRTFYEDCLGFWYTDEFEGIATFLTCNRDHHVVNLGKLPQSRVHHIAFELKDSAAHPTACDQLRKAGITTLWGPSRHTAGHNLASYHYDPDRVLIELYTEMDVFIPELGMCEARPWHEHFPMKPRVWKLSELSGWTADFAFNLGEG